MTKKAIKRSWAEPFKIRALKMVYEPEYLRFFRARFERM